MALGWKYTTQCQSQFKAGGISILTCYLAITLCLLREQPGLRHSAVHPGQTSLVSEQFTVNIRARAVLATKTQ